MSAEPETCSWCKRYVTRHMDAYYFGFEPTGVVEIDNILCSIATAGKGAHSTEHWHDYGYPKMIQDAANIAAAKLRKVSP